MAGNLVQVGSSDGKVRVAADGRVIVAGAGDPCCCGGSGGSGTPCDCPCTTCSGTAGCRACGSCCYDTANARMAISWDAPITASTPGWNADFTALSAADKITVLAAINRLMTGISVTGIPILETGGTTVWGATATNETRVSRYCSADTWGFSNRDATLPPGSSSYVNSAPVAGPCSGGTFTTTVVYQYVAGAIQASGTFTVTATIGVTNNEACNGAWGTSWPCNGLKQAYGVHFTLRQRRWSNTIPNPCDVTPGVPTHDCAETHDVIVTADPTTPCRWFGTWTVNACCEGLEPDGPYVELRLIGCHWVITVFPSGIGENAKVVDTALPEGTYVDSRGCIASLCNVEPPAMFGDWLMFDLTGMVVT